MKALILLLMMTGVCMADDNDYRYRMDIDLNYIPLLPDCQVRESLDHKRLELWCKVSKTEVLEDHVNKLAHAVQDLNYRVDILTEEKK